MSELVYRSMTLPDIEQVYEIECSCFSQPWSVESLIGEVIRNDAASYVVAEDNGKIVGYAGMWQMRRTPWSLPPENTPPSTAPH